MLLRTYVGMLDAGVGETHVNNILTALDIPPVSHKTLKKSERSVGAALEKKHEKAVESILRQSASKLSKLSMSAPLLHLHWLLIQLLQAALLP